MSVSITYAVEMKLAGLAGAWTDVSADVRMEDGVQIEGGIMGRGAEARVADPGACRLSMDNDDTNSAATRGYYAPWSTSCRSGFGYGIPLRVTLTTGGVPTVVFVGRIASVSVDPGARTSACARVIAYDPLYNLGRMTFPSGLDIATSKRADELIPLVLALDPDYGQLYTGSFGTGQSTFAYAFDSIQDKVTTLREELHRICMSEPGHVYFDPTGPSLVFAPYGARAVAPTIMATLTNTMRELSAPSEVNDQPARVDVTAYAVVIDGTSAPFVLYSLGQTDRLVQPGEVLNLFGPYRDPNSPSDRVGGKSFTAVTATTDYTMNTAQDGSGTDLTASFSVTADAKGNGVYWTIQNNSTLPGYITLLQIRGQMVSRRPTTMTATNAYDSYSSRADSFDMPYQNQLAAAQDLANFYAYLYAEPTVRRVEAVTFEANYDSTLATAALTLITGAHIAITETMLGLSGSEFTINGRRLDLQPGQVLCTWILETEETNRWIDVAFAAGNFTANGAMTWTLTSSDQLAFAYRIDGDTMRVCFYLQTTTVGGTPNTQLRITIPAGKTAAMTNTVPCQLSDAGTRAVGRASVTSGDTYIAIQLVGATNFSASTNLTEVYGTLAFKFS